MNSQQQSTIRVVIGVIFIVIGCVFLLDTKLQAKSYTRELEEAFAAKLRIEQEDNGFDTSMLMAEKMHKSDDTKVGKDIITDMKKIRKPMLNLLASSQWTPSKDFLERLNAVEKALKKFSENHKKSLEQKDEEDTKTEDKKDEAKEDEKKETAEVTDEDKDDKDSEETDEEIKPETEKAEETKDKKDEMGMVIPPVQTPKDEEAPKLPEPKKEDEPEAEVTVPGEVAGSTTTPGETPAEPEAKPIEPQPAAETEAEEKVDETLDATADQMNQEEESAGMQIPVEEPKPATPAVEPTIPTP